MTSTARQSNEIAVRCEGITKTYGKGPSSVKALQGIDLEVRHGEVLMIVGPSGCGKTTLISIISAILDYDEGHCEIFGQDLSKIDENARTRFRGRSIGFVFQLFNLLPALSALENIAVPKLLAGVSRRQALKQATEVLDTVGLSDRGDAFSGELSGGQQQRVAIGRALMNDPALIICDEPTSSLDHESGADMMKLLREIVHEHDTTLIVVTHDTRIMHFADRIVRMEDGRIVDKESMPKDEKGVSH